MKPTRLAALLIWGVTAFASQATPASKPVAQAVPPKADPAAQATPPPTDEERVAKLRELVVEAEKALEAEDEDAAFDRSDEAEVLVADWDQALLQRPDVQILLERLKGVQNQVPQDGEPQAADQTQPQAQEPEAGLKEPGQVTILKGSDLTSEQARVQAAESGATYDFPIDLNDKVLTWVRLFTTDKRGYMERTLSRGAAYFPMIRQVFAEEGIPQDLAYLGVVESGYINKAKSYARAVGMWQFMPSTGRLFGLKINRWVDERRDPVKATHAAARYLRRLYETSGDWYLALVGYNAGPLTTQKAQTNLGTSNFWDMYRSPYLRNQTKNYVPELCAAILIARNPDRYGFQEASDAPFVYETVQVRSATNLRTIARAAGVSEAVIHDLNPQLLRGSTPPGPYEVRVPVGKGLEAQRRLGGLPARKGNLPEADTGDERGSAAERRRIEAPVPQPAPVAPLDAIPPIPGGRTPASAAAAPASDRTYHAKTGDTLARISRAQGVSFAELVRLNPEAAKHLAVGDTVILPFGAEEAPRSERPRFHRVQSGETLSSIAERYRLNPAELKRWNGLRTTRIRAGQRLRLAPR